MYVEELIGPNTVNTVPPATINGFQDHGSVALTVEQDVSAARQVMQDLDTETGGKRRKCYPLWYEATSLLMVYRKTGKGRYKQISKS